MTVFRINKTKDYTVMGNYHFKNKDMSLKAIGMLSLMLSLPDDWDYSVEGLTSIRCENKSTINTILKELEYFGYLKRTKVRNEKGIYTNCVYDIYEEPYTKNPYMENPYMEKPYMEKPSTENSPQLNTNKLNTKESNTKEINKENIIKEIISYLNEKANTRYKPTIDKTKNLIKARLNDGFVLEDFKKVIDIKTNEWLNTDMQKYLRPETLFSNKFEGYLNQKSNELPEWYDKDYKLNEESDEEYERRKREFIEACTKS